MKKYRPERERDVVTVCEDAAKARGGVALPFVTPGRIGAPDRLVILPGPRMGFCELKKHDVKKLRPGQPRYHQMLRDLGCYVAVCRLPSQVVRFYFELERMPPQTLPQHLILEWLLA